MKILVTGSAGQLGSCIRDSVVDIQATDSRDTFIFTDASTLDICDEAAVISTITDLKPDVIINCAAYTAVDAAEDNPQLAFLLNARAPGYLAAAAGIVGATLIHISTDYIFGNAIPAKPISEDAPANPGTVYGLTKLQGEQAIAATRCKAIIIRTAWLYSEHGHNFLRTILDLTATRTTIKVVNDQHGTPTYARDLADFITGIISHRQLSLTGTYHYSNEGTCTWFDFATAIADEARHNDCHITQCTTAEYPARATRPAYSVLDKTRVKTTFGVDIPHWRTSLRRCLANINPQPSILNRQQSSTSLS